MSLSKFFLVTWLGSISLTVFASEYKHNPENFAVLYPSDSTRALPYQDIYHDNDPVFQKPFALGPAVTTQEIAANKSNTPPRGNSIMGIMQELSRQELSRQPSRGVYTRHARKHAISAHNNSSLKEQTGLVNSDVQKSLKNLACTFSPGEQSIDPESRQYLERLASRPLHRRTHAVSPRTFEVAALTGLDYTQRQAFLKNLSKQVCIWSFTSGDSSHI